MSGELAIDLYSECLDLCREVKKDVTDSNNILKSIEQKLTTLQTFDTVHPLDRTLIKNISNIIKVMQSKFRTVEIRQIELVDKVEHARRVLDNENRRKQHRSTSKAIMQADHIRSRFLHPSKIGKR